MRKRLSLLRALACGFGLLAVVASGSRPARAGEFCVLPPTHTDSMSGPLRQQIWSVVREVAEQKAAAVPLQAGAGAQPINTVGQVNALILLVEFGDTPATRPNQFMRNMFFGTAEESPNGSVQQYYLENSYGKLTLGGRVFGDPHSSVTDHPDPARQVKWLRMTNTYEYYAAGAFGLFGPDPHNAGQLVRDALAAVATNYPTLDWSEFDGNGDGYLDMLYIVHAGPGAEGSGDPNEIWSHQSEIPDMVVGTGADGRVIKASHYAMGAEDNNVGVHAHEMGHVFGLPDLYTNPQGLSIGLGNWSIMAAGAHIPQLPSADIQGWRPVQFDAWCKAQLGWLTPTTITKNTDNITLPPVQTNPAALKVSANPNNPLEYYLIENRPILEGSSDAPRVLNYFDTFNNVQAQDIAGGLPGSGVIIYHVDERRGTNDDRGHMLISVVEADQGEIDPNTGRPSGVNLLLPVFHPLSNYGDPGDPFGNTNKSFTNKTVPQTVNYDGKDSGVRITGITAPALVDTDLNGDATPDGQVVKAAAANATLNVHIASIIGAAFSPTAGGTAPTLTLTLLDAGGVPIPNANVEILGTEFNIYDLEPGDYKLKIESANFIPQFFDVHKGEGPSVVNVFLTAQLQASQFNLGWNMVTFPYDFGGARVSEVFNLPTLQSYFWNGTAYDTDPVVVAGQGYWIYVTDPTQLKINRPGQVVPSDVNQTVPVKAGWNLIGNPFPRAIAWDSAVIKLQTAAGTTVTLDQANDQNLASNTGWIYNAATNAYRAIHRGDTVPIYQGFWFFSNTAGNLIFPAPGTPPS